MEDLSETSTASDALSSDSLKRKEADESSLIPFVCSICGLSAKCYYGIIRVNGRTHNYTYKEEVYYMMDPFRNRALKDQRRLTSDAENEKSMRKNVLNNACNILDFFVIGALCTLCGQPVCVDELCSMFYAKTFCTLCVNKEKDFFPKELLQQLGTAMESRKRREATVIKPPAVVETNKDA